MFPVPHRSSASRFAPRALLARMGKPALLLLILLVNLLISGLYISSIQREQHGLDNFDSGSQATSAWRRSNVALTPDCTCPAEVNAAIAQLEQLKSEMRGGNALAQPCTPADEPSSLTTATPLSDAGTASRKPFLIIGIPSMPRSSGVDYLTGVLGKLDAQLEHDPLDPMYGEVRVWVMNNAKHGDAHPSFDANVKRYARRREFAFFVNEHSLTDPRGPGATDAGGPNLPGVKVRKQTRDIVRLMQMAADKSVYYLAMEDDFHLCPNGLAMILHALRKGRAARGGPLLEKGDFISMKFSFGFNGLALHNDADLQHFAAYLLEHQARRPPDHLNTEWTCSEKPEARAYVQGRTHFTYRYNLFEHMGVVSSLKDQEKGAYPSCLHHMNSGVVFDVDAFNFQRCAHDDLTPCMPPPTDATQQADKGAWRPPYGIDSKVEEEENRPKGQ